jgi:hypothetical protein
LRPILSVLLIQEFFLSLLRRSGCEGRTRSLNCVRDGEPVEPFPEQGGCSPCPHKEYRTCFQHATFAAALRSFYRRVRTAESEDRRQRPALSEVERDRRQQSVVRPPLRSLCVLGGLLRRCSEPALSLPKGRRLLQRNIQAKKDNAYRPGKRIAETAKSRLK